MKIISFIILSCLISSSNLKGCNENDILEINSNNMNLNDTVSTNYVPDEETAKKIAEAIWLPIYGERVLQQRPYKAILSENIWIVKGLKPYPFRNNPEFRGGTAYIEIQKSDGKIVKVSHGR